MQEFKVIRHLCVRMCNHTLLLGEKWVVQDEFTITVIKFVNQSLLLLIHCCHNHHFMTFSCVVDDADVS